MLLVRFDFKRVLLSGTWCRNQADLWDSVSKGSLPSIPAMPRIYNRATQQFRNVLLTYQLFSDILPEWIATVDDINSPI
jgi:hypothetical protein